MWSGRAASPSPASDGAAGTALGTAEGAASADGGVEDGLDGSRAAAPGITCTEDAAGATSPPGGGGLRQELAASRIRGERARARTRRL